MPARLLIDNWTLQSCRELFSDGLTGDTASELIASASTEKPVYRDVSADVVQIQSLIQTLNDVVFADEVFVDAEFAHVWEASAGLQPLADSQTVVRKPLTAAKPDWREVRDAMAIELCGSEAIRQRHLENVESCKRGCGAVDRFLSQLIWGGAGMLARATFLKVPYSPHPLRGRMLKDTGFIQPQGAHERFFSFIESQRANVYATTDGNALTGAIVLPPAAVSVIADANDVAGLFRIAVELRSEYRELRQWIAEFQQALDAENGEELLSRKKLLNSVARELNALSTPSDIGEVSLQFGVDGPKLSIKLGAPLNPVLNRFSIRAQIKNLVLTKNGHAAFRHLLKLLGEERSACGRAVEREFLQQT
jgi:hypothetical protein